MELARRAVGSCNLEPISIALMIVKSAQSFYAERPSHHKHDTALGINDCWTLSDEIEVDAPMRRFELLRHCS